MRQRFILAPLCIALASGQLSLGGPPKSRTVSGTNVVSGTSAPASPERLDVQSAPKVQLVRSSCSCGNCCVAESDNFRIHWCTAEFNVRALALECERLRAKIFEAWFRESERDRWTPRCEVVVHANVVAYTSSLGAGSEQTSGCATLKLDSGRVTVRRLDLRVDAEDWQTESLPHELTHIVLADHFNTHRIPSWADEGIAMLAESPAKLTRRCDALANVMRAVRVPTIEQIVSMKQRTRDVDPTAFYGQSAALVVFLLKQGTPQQLIQFVDASQREGAQHAMREVYGIASWAELEKGWRQNATGAQVRQFARHTFPAEAVASLAIGQAK